MTPRSPVATLPPGPATQALGRIPATFREGKAPLLPPPPCAASFLPSWGSVGRRRRGTGRSRSSARPAATGRAGWLPRGRKMSSRSTEGLSSRPGARRPTRPEGAFVRACPTVTARRPARRSRASGRGWSSCPGNPRRAAAPLPGGVIATGTRAGAHGPGLDPPRGEEEGARGRARRRRPGERGARRIHHAPDGAPPAGDAAPLPQDGGPLRGKPRLPTRPLTGRSPLRTP